MNIRTLGSQGLEVSAEGLGCMGMSMAYGRADEAESLGTIDRALELGVTLLDTADLYGPLHNEQLLGRALAGRRDGVVLATKFGFEISPDGKRTGKLNGRPEYVRAALEGSLARLDVEHIDLYYQHRVDPEVPVEETFGTLAELVAEGKVRYLGISEAAPDTIRRAHAVHPLSAVQTEYSLFARDVEDDGVLATTRRLGIGFVAYSPLGRGMLAGRITDLEDLAPDDYRRIDPRYQDGALAQNLAVVQALSRIAAAKGVSPSQLALAWVLHQDAIAIPGTKRRRYVEENVAAADIVLGDDELAVLDAAAPRGAVAGDRYPAAMMGNVYA